MKKKAFLTGGSRGIGSSIKTLLESNQIEVISPGREALDLGDSKSIEKYLKYNQYDFDILINNAGINKIQEIQDLDDENISNTLEINLVTPLKLIRGLVPGMIRKGGGRIVNISSIWSVVSKPGRSIYAISKTGINSMTRSLSVELGKYNILINAVAPGYINTELTTKNNSPEALRTIIDSIPMKRMAEPAEIAELVYFLISEKNTYITGQTIVADGGYTCL